MALAGAATRGPIRLISRNTNACTSSPTDCHSLTPTESPKPRFSSMNGAEGLHPERDFHQPPMG